MTVSAGRAFGQQLPPRALYFYDQPERLAEATALGRNLSDVIPTSHVLSHVELPNVRQASYGLAVVLGDRPLGLSNQLHAVQVGGCDLVEIERVGSPMQQGVGPPRPVFQQFQRDDVSAATSWIVPAALDERYQQLVCRDLVPLVPRASSRPTGHSGLTATLTLRSTWSRPSGTVTRLLVDDDDQAFAVRLVSTGGVWRWVLPQGVNADAWVRLALRDLYALDAVEFPLRSSWAMDQRYMTAAEIVAARELDDIESTRLTVEQELQRRERDAIADQATARSEAEQNHRRLITAQSDALVDAVADTLRAFDFDVTKSDDDARPGDKLEDLRVRLQADDDVVALVEVRGYAAGAQLNDLLRINRFAMRFAADRGRVPDRLWYVANPFAGKGPGDRIRPLASNRAEVATFAELAGLVVDTADLLELRLRVERGEVSREDARDALWNAAGFFEVPPVA